MDRGAPAPASRRGDVGVIGRRLDRGSPTERSRQATRTLVAVIILTL